MLKDRLRELVQLSFIKKNSQRSAIYRKGQILFCRRQKPHSDSTKKFSETDIINMLEFLIDNILAMFGGRDFQQTITWYKWCASSRRLVPLFACGRLHTGASQKKRKETSLILEFHVPLYR